LYILFCFMWWVGRYVWYLATPQGGGSAAPALLLPIGKVVRGIWAGHRKTRILDIEMRNVDTA
jgi:hypothetical protein